MRKSQVRTLVVGAAALLAVGAAAASAQDTTRARPRTQPRSTTRIPVTKEQPGEVVTPRVDTLTVYRTDTLRIAGPMRVDTVSTTVTRYDTTRIETMPGYLAAKGGLYFGLGGGIMTPRASFRNVNASGLTAQAQLGWQPVHSLLGLRGDVNYGSNGEEQIYASLGGRPDIITVNGDVKLQLPFIANWLSTNRIPVFSVYAIGGGTYAHYKNLRNELESGNTAGGVATAPTGQSITVENGSKFGWNAGGGMSWHWGTTELFVESRILSFTANSASDAGHQVPFIVGFNWY